MDAWRWVTAAVVALGVGAMVWVMMRRSGASNPTQPASDGDATSTKGAGAPKALTPDDALDATPRPPSMDARRRADELADQASGRIAAAWATTDFANDGRRVVLENVCVLVCEDPVRSEAELVDPLCRAQREGHPLVVVVPEIDDQACRTLIMNHRHDTVPCLAVIGESDARSTLASRTGVTERSHRSDRQAGYLPAEQWGHADLWVSDKRHTWLG